jgi:hypothetical protein
MPTTLAHMISMGLNGGFKSPCCEGSTPSPSSPQHACAELLLHHTLTTSQAAPRLQSQQEGEDEAEGASLGGRAAPGLKGQASSPAGSQHSPCLAEVLRLSDHDGTLRYIVSRKVSET